MNERYLPGLMAGAVSSGRTPNTMRMRRRYGDHRRDGRQRPSLVGAMEGRGEDTALCCVALRISIFSSPSCPSFTSTLFLLAMSSHSGNPMSPPPVPAANNSNNTGGVRRHHTISASSRTARPTSKIALGELDDPQTEQLWNDDEPVDQDWVGGIGPVGEKSSLHRQASLPTKYHRGKYSAIQLASSDPRDRRCTSCLRDIV